MKNNCLIIIYGILILISSCKKDEDIPPPPDPCEGVMEVSANFKIYEAYFGDFYGEGLIFESDTVMTKNRVILIANENNADSYLWTINGNTFSGQKVTYQASDSNKVDTITLIVNKTPSECFQGDDGIDTITKYVTTIPWSEWPFEGEFLGNLTNETGLDTFRIQIDVIPSTINPGSVSGLHIYNLDKNNCDKNAGTYGKLYYKYFKFHVNWSSCNTHYASALQPFGKSSLKLDYQSTPVNAETSDITFIGLKQ